MHPLIGEKLRKVYALPYPYPVGESFRTVAMHIGDHLFRISAITETDEIGIELLPDNAANDLKALDSDSWLNRMIGLQLQSVWICDNEQGYRDLVVLAFEHLMPNVAFVSEGSALKLLQLVHRGLSPQS